LEKRLLARNLLQKRLAKTFGNKLAFFQKHSHSKKVNKQSNLWGRKATIVALNTFFGHHTNHLWKKDNYSKTAFNEDINVLSN